MTSAQKRKLKGMPDSDIKRIKKLNILAKLPLPEVSKRNIDKQLALIYEAQALHVAAVNVAPNAPQRPERGRL